MAPLTVRLWGVDAHAQPFMQTARAKNISQDGAVIHGLTCQVRAGEIVEVQFGKEKAQFRVVWVGRTGTAREGEIGVENLPGEKRIWSEDFCRYSAVAGKG